MDDKKTKPKKSTERVVTERIRLSTRQLESMRIRGETVYVKLGTNIMGDDLVAALRWSGR
jgi:hypothetical protein